MLYLLIGLPLCSETENIMTRPSKNTMSLQSTTQASRLTSSAKSGHYVRILQWYWILCFSWNFMEPSWVVTLVFILFQHELFLIIDSLIVLMLNPYTCLWFNFQKLILWLCTYHLYRLLNLVHWSFCVLHCISATPSEMKEKL